MIVAEAVKFFAENGFDGTTMALAKRLGVTQPLLYRYFPTKDALIERVYQEVFHGNWNPEWERLLENRSVSLHDRLVSFYRQYAAVMMTYEFVRLFLFAGLAGMEFNVRFYGELRRRIFDRIARELQHEYTGAAGGTISGEELEIAQSLHGSIFHLGLRRWVHTPPLKGRVEDLIESKVALFLAGAARRIPQVAATRNATGNPKRGRA